MSEVTLHRSYHRIVTIGLVLLNLLAIAYAVYSGSPQLDWHFQDGSLLTGLGSAQMLGAAVLFIACFFAETIIPRLEAQAWRRPYAWLVFALGFFLLALDQQFFLREQLTLLIDGVPVVDRGPSVTHSALKIGSAVLALLVVAYFRTTVLANVRMVLAFIVGFWFLLLMLLFDMLFDSVGVSPVVVTIMEGSSKLLAVAMFLSAAYIALLDIMAESRGVAARLGILEDWQRRHSVAQRAALARAAEQQARAEASDEGADEELKDEELKDEGRKNAEAAADGAKEDGGEEDGGEEDGEEAEKEA
jgi:hypothetical protein